MQKNLLARLFRGLRVPPRQVGMTLVEIMIVLTIMAGIMAFAAYSVVGYLRGSKIKDAQAETAQLREMVENYRLMCGDLPDQLEQLAEDCGMGQVAERVPADPWDQPYEYDKENDGSFIIFSMGPDEQSGGDDDIYPEGMGPQN